MHINISEQKKFEEALRQAKEDAEAANNAKSIFLANMSHEIRTPMNAVIGFSDILSSVITDNKQKSYLESIQVAGRNLLRLINDILDLSKIEAGRLEIQYEPVNPHAIFNEIKQIFQMKISDKHLEFIIDIDTDIPDVMMMDETRLRQVLFNLVGNAVNFTESGYIKLSARKVYIEKESSKLDLVLFVEDSGIGIPEDQISQIFESFKQQDGQSTRKYGGTGLGLSITKRLVEMMNGNITVRSTPGKGSVFEITLRGVDISAGDFTTSRSEAFFDINSISFAHARVLVVDDIDSNRKFFRESLTLAGLDILEANNGQQGVQIAEEALPDVILMDIRMPVMDGYEATELIRTNPITSKIPIIAITASIGTAKPEEWKQSGFDGFLSKPVNLNELFNELFNYLKHSKKYDPAEINALPENMPEAFNAEEMENMPELLRVVDSEIVPEWKNLSGAIEIDAVEKFGQKLSELSERHHWHLLQKYARDLLEFTEAFDIEKNFAHVKGIP